jgi:hypothetical protein
MGEWLLSRRDSTIAARQEVPGFPERLSVPEGRSKSSQSQGGDVRNICLHQDVLFLETYMSENLNLLRQNYCRPGSFTSKRNDRLFPLEEKCEEGKTLLATTPKAILHFQEFDPNGLEQTYRDEASGAELPVFAVFDLEGSHRLTVEITTDSSPAIHQSKSLPAYVPFRKAEPFVWKINHRRIKAGRAVTWLSLVLGILPVLIFLESHTISIFQAAVPHILLGGWILGAFLFYVLGLFMLNQFCPWKKLVVTAEFNGILPKVASHALA